MKESSSASFSEVKSQTFQDVMSTGNELVETSSEQQPIPEPAPQADDSSAAAPSSSSPDKKTTVELKVSKIETTIRPEQEPVVDAAAPSEAQQEEVPLSEVPLEPAPKQEEESIAAASEPVFVEQVEIVPEVAPEPEPIPVLEEAPAPAKESEPVPEAEAAPAVSNGKTSEIQQESIKNALKEIISEIDKVVGEGVEFGITPSAGPPPALVDVGSNKENELIYQSIDNSNAAAVAEPQPLNGFSQLTDISAAGVPLDNLEQQQQPIESLLPAESQAQVIKWKYDMLLFRRISLAHDFDR